MVSFLVQLLQLSNFFMIRLQFSLTHAQALTWWCFPVPRTHSWSILLQKWLLILLKSTLSFIWLPTSQIEIVTKEFRHFFPKKPTKEIGPLIETAVERTLKWTWKKTKLQTFIVRNLLDQLKSTYITTPSHQIPKIHLISKWICITSVSTLVAHIIVSHFCHLMLNVQIRFGLLLR